MLKLTDVASQLYSVNEYHAAKEMCHKIVDSLFFSISFFKYSARILIEAQIIEAAAYCYQILMVPLYVNSTQNTLVH